MRSSNYIHRVTVQSEIISQDSVGTETSSWVDGIKLWCAILQESRPTDDYVEAANTQVYESKLSFLTYKTRRVTLHQRLKFEDKQYEILDIRDDTGRNRETKILARLARES